MFQAGTFDPQAFYVNEEPGFAFLAGTFDSATFDTGLTSGRLTAAPGVYTITGTAAFRGSARGLAALPGSYAITGVPATTRRGRRVTAVPGLYTITGTAAQLTRAGGISAPKRLTAAPGVYTLTGVATQFKRTRVPTLTPGAAVVYRNLADAAVVTASSSAGLMPPKRLLDPHIARTWRGGGNSSEWLLADLGSAVAIDTVALVGLNLTAAGSTRVRISSADSSGLAGDVYDSKMMTGKVDPAYGYFVQLLIQPVFGRYVRIDLSDTIPYIEAGRIIVGKRAIFETNFSVGWSRGYTDLSRRTTSRGGQIYINRGAQFRTVEVSFDWLNGQERHGFVEEIDRECGMHTDVLFIADQTSDNLGRDSIWGLLDDLEGVVQPYSLDIFRKQYRIGERL